MSINERLTYYTKIVLGKSQKEVSQDTGLSTGKINSVFNDNQDSGGKVILAFIKAYKELNPMWLITGEGDMTINNESEKYIKMNTDLYNYNILVKRVEEITEEIKQLRAEIAAWKAREEEK